jgi:hypothetical protein
MARVNYRHQKNLREQQKKKRNDEKRLKKERPSQAGSTAVEPATEAADRPAPGAAE